MPSIEINKTVFEKLVGKKLPVSKLKDRISMLGTDLEGIEGNKINLEIFPNRPDMLSEQGFARAFSSFIGARKGLRKYTVKPSKEKIIIDRSVGSVRPFTACAIVKGIKFDDERIREVIQIQEKLHITYCRNRSKGAIGIYPLEKIKFPIRYTAKKPNEFKFRPLESAKEMNGLQILSQPGREYAGLLKDKAKFPLFIDDDGQILSMPPIINSHDVGKIGRRTKDVFVECSGFDLNFLKKCLNMIVTALADMGGNIYSLELQYPTKKYVTPDLSASKMKIRLDYVNKRLGLELKETELKRYLERMGYGYAGKTALVPAYRTDVLHPIDLVEDIAIAYGYENIEETIPSVATIGEESKFEVFKSRIAGLMVGLRLIEVNTYSLTSKNFQTERMNAKIPVIELSNSSNIEYSVLRAWVVPSLMEVLKDNKHHEYPQRIFDIGTVFKKDLKSETGTAEADRLCVLDCSEDVDYTTMKQYLDYIMRALDLKYEVEETEHDSFTPGRVGRIVVNGVKVAYVGEIHPEVLANWGIDLPVGAIELNLSDLFSAQK